MIKNLIFHFKNSLYIIFLITSCNSNKENSLKDNAEITLDVKNFKEGQLISNKIIKHISFIPLETNEKNLFTTIGKMYRYNDYFIIQDNSYALGILVFDKTGKFVNSIGKYGRGPGEVINFTDFTIDEEENLLLILDQVLHKITYYNLNDFSYIKETKFDKSIFTQGFTAAGKGTLSLCSIRQGNKQGKQYNIVNLDVNNNTWNGFLERADYEINTSYRHLIFESKNRYYAPFYGNTIYKLTEKEPVPYIVMDFGNYAFPLEDYKGIPPREVIHKRNEGVWTCGINNVIDNNSMLTFNIVVANQRTQIIYSKVTGNYYYGNKYNGEYGILSTPENLAADDKCFYGVIDGFVFSRRKKRVLKLPEGPFKEAYLKALKNVNISSNPVIVAIEYKSF
jgi:hypothetical protein